MLNGPPPLRSQKETVRVTPCHSIKPHLWLTCILPHFRNGIKRAKKSQGFAHSFKLIVMNCRTSIADQNNPHDLWTIEQNPEELSWSEHCEDSWAPCRSDEVCPRPAHLRWTGPRLGKFSCSKPSGKFENLTEAKRYQGKGPEKVSGANSVPAYIGSVYYIGS